MSPRRSAEPHKTHKGPQYIIPGPHSKEPCRHLLSVFVMAKVLRVSTFKTGAVNCGNNDACLSVRGVHSVHSRRQARVTEDYRLRSLLHRR
ncbi:hypothetical protein K438DRAFT_1815469 [Mycena galopus ATCC 62051]|nr:hypothetical protein K438DRAFT_1815469 [Mycena galopus ATCC 62051]